MSSKKVALMLGEGQISLLIELLETKGVAFPIASARNAFEVYETLKEGLKCAKEPDDQFVPPVEHV